MQWHRNCHSARIQGSPACTIGNWGMDHSKSRGVICATCQVPIYGRAIAISATECMCSDCWQSFLRQLFREPANRNEASQSAEVEGESPTTGLTCRQH